MLKLNSRGERQTPDHDDSGSASGPAGRSGKISKTTPCKAADEIACGADWSAAQIRHAANTGGGFSLRAIRPTGYGLSRTMDCVGQGNAPRASARGALIHFSNSQIFKQKPARRASHHQNNGSRLAARRARVVEKPSAHEGRHHAQRACGMPGA
jgi:hypothetical protein